MWSGSIDVESFLLGVLALAVLCAAVSVAHGALQRLTTTADRRIAGLKVVVTGSTRGLGLQLARQFLQLGDSVVVSSRSSAAVEAAVQQLCQEFPSCRLVGVACDVSQPADVEALLSAAQRELGGIDILVCNAALSAGTKAPVVSTPVEELAAIIATNLAGSLLCARAAMACMAGQPSGGRVFLMDGSGSRGGPTPGNAAYGATKQALVQLAGSLAAEGRGMGVGVHILSPGMVATGLLLRYATNPRSARAINILAERPEAVARWLVPRIRGARGTLRYIRYMTAASVAWRFLTAPARRGRFVPEGGRTSGSSGGGGGNGGAYQRLPCDEEAGVSKP